MKIVQDKKHKNLYRIKWPDGTISISTPNPDKKGGHYGFYNKTRANEIARLAGDKTLEKDQSYGILPDARLDR